MGTRAVDQPVAVAQDWFLPEFCRLPVLFAVVLVAQLFAFIIVLATPRADVWLQLSHTSLFIQWIVLTSVGSLCAAGALLRRLPPYLATAVSYLLLLAVTAVYSLAAVWVMGAEHWAGHGAADGEHGFVTRNLIVSAIISGLVLRYAYIHHQWERRIRSEAQARLDALQARIRPHFLFNSMNTIASLTRSRPEQAEAVVENLSELFRASLADPGNASTLEQELYLTRRYIEIEAMRLGERLRVHWQLEGMPGDALIPPLTIQPLAENAIYYGVETAVEGGSIVFSSECSPEHVTLHVVNDLPEAGRNRYRRGNGLAVDNIRRRLEAFFDGRADLFVRQSEDRYQVSIMIPIQCTFAPERYG